MTVLINAQWQASGCGHRYPIGAERIRRMLPASLVSNVPDISYEQTAAGTAYGVRQCDAVLRSVRLVSAALDHYQTPLYNLGCDCGGELVPVARLNDLHGGDLRVIWFDAHPDLNSVETSLSHNFHGMVLRALLGDPPKQLASFVPVPLKPENIILAGVRSIDRAEREYIEHNQIQVISAETINQGFSLRHLSTLCGGCVHVHVDYDVLDPLQHPNAVFQVAGGVQLPSLIQWIQGIRQHFDAVGFALTEYAPASVLSADDDVRAILSAGFGLPVEDQP